MPKIPDPGSQMYGVRCPKCRKNSFTFLKTKPDLLVCSDCGTAYAMGADDHATRGEGYRQQVTQYKELMQAANDRLRDQ